MKVDMPLNRETKTNQNILTFFFLRLRLECDIYSRDLINVSYCEVKTFFKRRDNKNAASSLYSDMRHYLKKKNRKKIFRLDHVTNAFPLFVVFFLFFVFFFCVCVCVCVLFFVSKKKIQLRKYSEKKKDKRK